MRHMYHHKTPSTGGIQFIGWDDERKVYSTDYYANVGIMNAAESTHVTLKKVRELRKELAATPGYTEVQYLKERRVM